MLALDLLGEAYVSMEGLVSSSTSVLSTHGVAAQHRKYYL